jgi:hypothetical protein
MTDRDELIPPGLRDAVAALPRERDPGAALEDRVVRALVASGEIGSGQAGRQSTVSRLGVRPRQGMWISAVAATLIFAVALSLWTTRRRAPLGDPYVLFLMQDSAYQAPPPGHWPERVAEYARWADSLNALGKIDLEAQVTGPGPLTGMFIVRAVSDADAARIARSCPHLRYGGHIDTHRLIE